MTCEQLGEPATVALTQSTNPPAPGALVELETEQRRLAMRRPDIKAEQDLAVG